jgi:hypothetical protein
MLTMGWTEIAKVKGNLRVLKLHRETLRELGAGELTQGQGGRNTAFCDTERRCTRGCGPFTNKC